VINIKRDYRGLLVRLADTLLPWGITVCVSGVWAGVDNVWEQKKLEARKMLVSRAESHTSTARGVRPHFGFSRVALLHIRNNIGSHCYIMCKSSDKGQ